MSQGPPSSHLQLEGIPAHHLAKLVSKQAIGFLQSAPSARAQRWGTVIGYLHTHAHTLTCTYTHAQGMKFKPSFIIELQALDPLSHVPVPIFLLFAKLYKHHFVTPAPQANSRGHK